MRFTSISTLILSFVVFHSVAETAVNAAAPNIVIFLADDLGWGDLGCQGHPKIKSPNLDAFAKQGVRFTQCYSASGVCSPSRSAIVTGRTPYRNGVFNWIPEGSPMHLRSSEITSAALLRGVGYATCHSGKWHLNGMFNKPEQPQPNNHGFDWWFSTQNNAGPSHKNPKNFARNGAAVGELQGFSAPLVVEEAITWLKKHRDPKQPFFLCVWTHEPHLPIESDPQFMKLYDGESDDIQQHHGNVTQMDFAFGQLMKTLDELQEADNTFVMFTADNGPEGAGTMGRTRGSTGGLRGRKRDVYEGGIRVPGIVRWPAGKIPTGITSDIPVIGTDLFVTACKLGGAKLPSDRVLDGGDLLVAVENKPVPRPRPLYWRCPLARGELKIALRIGDMKLLSNEKLTEFELYDLKTDPREEQNLAATQPAKLTELVAELRKLNAEIEAEGPTWWKTLDQGKKKAAKK